MTTATKEAKQLTVYYHRDGDKFSDAECVPYVESLAQMFADKRRSFWKKLDVSTENILYAIRAAVRQGKFDGVRVAFIEGSPVDHDAVRCEVDGEGRMLPVAVPQNGLTKRMLDSMLYNGGANVSKDQN